MGHLPDYYATLGVMPNSEDVVIRGAYRALMQKYHPDKFQGGREIAERKAKELNEAYEVLSDPEKRRTYDATRSRTRNQTSNSHYQGRGPQSASEGYRTQTGPTRASEKPDRAGLQRKAASGYFLYYILFLLVMGGIRALTESGSTPSSNSGGGKTGSSVFTPYTSQTLQIPQAHESFSIPPLDENAPSSNEQRANRSAADGIAAPNFAGSSPAVPVPAPAPAGSLPLAAKTPASKPDTNLPSLSESFSPPSFETTKKKLDDAVDTLLKPDRLQTPPARSNQSPDPSVSVLPEHAILDVFGHDWVCERGYRQQGGGCISVILPEHATLDVFGHEWTCERGYQQQGESCTPVKLPEHATLDIFGHDWTCEREYRQQGESCASVRLPEHATFDIFGHDWVCERGYRQQGASCTPVKLPDHATLDVFGHDWECERGYRSAGGTCVVVGVVRVR